MKPTLYAQRDPVEIEDKRYSLGDPISEDHNPNALNLLQNQGIISANQPVAAASIPAAEKAIEDMSRAELEAAVMTRTKDEVAKRPDEDLREALRCMSGKDKPEDDGGAGDGSTGGTPYADLKDKPLSSLKTADLDTIAREEGVSFEGAKNNPDRVKAIEAHREKVKAD